MLRILSIAASAPALARSISSTSVLFAGHSKWAKIARSKGVNDLKRSVIFAKVSAQIKAAVQAGGADPGGNLRLQSALDRAKELNVPKDIIERALTSGAGPGAAAEVVMYEGRGPGPSVFIVEALTDNRNRTSRAVRAMFSRAGGDMQSTGSVSWDFDFRGRIGIAAQATAGWEDALLEAALASGGLDVDFAADDAAAAHVLCEGGAVHTVRAALASAGFTVVSSSTARLSRTMVDLEPGSDEAVKFEELLEDFDEHPDVVAVSHNVNEDVEDDEDV